jgi:hypothetical protein
MRISPLHIGIGIVAIAVIGILIWRQFATSRPQAVRASDVQPGPIRHLQLPADLEARIRGFEPIFAEVYPKSHEEWLDGFMRDLNPEAEIAIWEAIAAAYQVFTEKHTLTVDSRKEAFGLLLMRSAADEQATLSGAKLRHLSPAEAEELVKLYSAQPKPVQVIKKQIADSPSNRG